MLTTDTWFLLMLLYVAGLEVRQYVPVWYIGTSLVGFKSYRHSFLADCHIGVKIINIVASRIQMCFLGAKYAKMRLQQGDLTVLRQTH